MFEEGFKNSFVKNHEHLAMGRVDIGLIHEFTKKGGALHDGNNSVASQYTALSCLN